MTNGQTERRAPTPVAFSPGARLGLIGLIVTLSLNFGALIWGAATINSAVTYGAEERARIVNQLESISVSLRVMENRLTRLETQLEEHDRRGP